MIDHMIMNSKKYWEGDMPCYVGKTFKSPTSPVDKWKTNTDDFYYVYPAHESVIPSGRILGQVEGDRDDKNEIFLMGGGADHYYLVKLTDLIQNGGVSASLTHVCHALSLVRKVLSMAIEKMKFQLKDWYEGTQPYYVGQTIKGVKSNLANFTLTSTAESIYFDTYCWEHYYDVSTLSASQVNGQKVLYQVTSKTNYLHAPNPSQVFLGFILKHIYDRSRDEYDDVMCWVKLNDILQNGGVSSSPLTHLYQGLRHLLNRKVALVND